MQYEQRVLPVSGLRVHWRAQDDHFRICPPDTEGLVSEQTPWRPASGHTDMAVGTSGPLDGDPAQMWWAVWGEYVGDDVVVTLDDLRHPAVTIVGKLWITEWCGPHRDATVVTAGRQAEIQFAAPTRQPVGRAEDPVWRGVESPAGFHQIPRIRRH